MATHFISFFFVFSLFLLFADGTTSLQNDSSDTFKVKAVSHATTTAKTNYKDILGLVAICSLNMGLVEENEDPCLSPRWTWIQCNSDANPRVIALNLHGKLLFGLFPDISSMDALQRIDLSQNSLIGEIPSFLGTFQDLQQLNLANNIFTGIVPDSLACNKNLKLSVAGNPDLYTSKSCSTSNTQSPTTNRNTDSSSSSFKQPAGTSSREKSSKLPVILGITIPVFVLVWIAVGIFAFYHQKAKAAAAIAEASKPAAGSNGTAPNYNFKVDIPTEERPINARADNISS